MVLNSCFFASIFYILPLYSFFYFPCMMLLLPVFLHKNVHGISWARCYIETILLLSISIALLMLLGLYVVGFLPYDCFYYLHQSVSFSLRQIGLLVLFLVALQSTILGYKKKAVQAVVMANIIAAAGMLAGYYVLFLFA